ncbi:hypothetical protein G6M89_05995 [Natronolimnobius sp. AArcel1]|uniref:hypothetical protein n=1 Tax=Natronolimnobius sp. AArcel1 TaxID=1679093 RepID=UPI0013EC1A02|nr:hypothetical protein [Natronolimnobius sp. AArcel1]NGM68567.1 hypothetical protein [Natronolimnobius sp. AArcel1]
MGLGVGPTTRSAVENARMARDVCETAGLTALARTALEYAISRPRLHPTLHWRVAETYYRRRCANDVASFPDAVAPDPFKLEWVSPERIVRHTRREYPPYRDRLEQFGAVQGGDWDQREDPPIDPDYEGPPAHLFLANRFEHSVLYRSLEAHFEDDVPWDETELVQRAKALVPKSTPERVWHECETNAAIDQRCRQLDTLYELIRDDGYRSQRERLGRDPSVGFRHCLRHEITVDIGRDGDLLLVSGKHRLAIVKLLGLEAVPVVFLVRHQGWMDRCVAASASESTHPDLRGC